MANEYEIKILDVDEDLMRIRLEEAGFKRLHPRFLMRRQTFTFKGDNTKWARVRKEYDKLTMTVKLVTDHTKIGGVQESELVIDSFDEACEFLRMCNLNPAAIEENYRETWQGNDTVITIDTWPKLPTFIEIEAQSEEKVRETSIILGVNYQEDHIGGVDRVYETVLGISPDTFHQLTYVTFERFE